MLDKKNKDEFHRFIGLSLAGGKTDKACMVVLEYYSRYHKIFLTRIFDKIKNEETESPDRKIVNLIEEYSNSTVYLACDTPWELPLCLRCTLVCPGYEMCGEQPILWMNQMTHKKNKVKKPKKNFTPYTQRAVEFYINQELEEDFQMPHTMGANTSPLLARAHFLKRRTTIEWLEVFPKLSVWRLGRSMEIAKSHLRFHRHSVTGDESREIILNELCDRNLAFVYDQDMKVMIHNNHAFEAFICALTAFLKYFKQTEPRPDKFPMNENWVEIPLQKISWEKI